jgi:hypothetical protein
MRVASLHRVGERFQRDEAFRFVPLLINYRVLHNFKALFRNYGDGIASLLIETSKNNDL